MCKILPYSSASHNKWPSSAMFQMFYDNETILENPIDILPNTFTHQNTPNDFFETNSDTMHKLGEPDIYYLMNELWFRLNNITRANVI